MDGEEQQQPFRNIQSINSAPILMWLHIVIRYPILGAEERQWRIAELSDPHPSIIYTYSQLSFYQWPASCFPVQVPSLGRRQSVLQFILNPVPSPSPLLNCFYLLGWCRPLDIDSIADIFNAFALGQDDRGQLVLCTFIGCCPDRVSSVSVRSSCCLWLWLLPSSWMFNLNFVGAVVVPFAYTSVRFVEATRHGAARRSRINSPGTGKIEEAALDTSGGHCSAQMLSICPPVWHT